MNNGSIAVLLVEDNEDDVLLLQESFAETGLALLTHISPNGRAALQHLRSEASRPGGTLPQLVLLDINLPGMNGFEVLKALKADPAICHIPVVVLTTSGREEDVVRSYAHGASSFICKPQGLAQLREVIRQFAAYWATIARVPPSQSSN